MAAALDVDKSNVILLCKGGYLPARRSLTDAERKANQVHHVDLMLDTVREHRMQRLEGFRFLAAQQPWERFWIAEFPEFTGAEAYVEGELLPPSGPFAYHEYYLARRLGKVHFDSWVANPREPIVAASDAGDPHDVPELAEDRSSVVVLEFVRWVPETGPMGSDQEQAQYEFMMKAIAKEHGLMALEAYKFVAPQAGWHQLWMAEYPNQEGAEAWMLAEQGSAAAGYGFKQMQLARRWSPDYFARWAAYGRG